MPYHFIFIVSFYCPKLTEKRTALIVIPVKLLRETKIILLAVVGSTLLLIRYIVPL